MPYDACLVDMAYAIRAGRSEFTLVYENLLTDDPIAEAKLPANEGVIIADAMCLSCAYYLPDTVFSPETVHRLRNIRKRRLSYYARKVAREWQPCHCVSPYSRRLPRYQIPRLNNPVVRCWRKRRASSREGHRAMVIHLVNRAMLPPRR